MRIVMLFILITGISISSYAQMDSDKMFYFKKIEKYRRMKTTGKLLAIGGTGLIVLGVVTLVNTSSTTYYNGNTGQTSTSDESRLVGGAIAYLVGVGGLSSGIPLWIVGGISEGKYTRLSQQNTVRLELDPKQSGLKLTYRF